MTLFSFLSPIIFIAVVTILGFVTPGYSHINHTISRLAIEKYGWIQTLNFIQLAVGFILIAKQTAQKMHNEESRRVVRIFFAFSASILVLAALAPADPIENVAFRFSLLTPAGFLHVSTICIFLIISPICIILMYKTFLKEPEYRKFALYTAYTGIGAFILSIVWIVFFVLGLFLEYRGIFQKAIVLFVIVWIMIISTHHHSPKAHV